MGRILLGTGQTALCLGLVLKFQGYQRKFDSNSMNTVIEKMSSWLKDTMNRLPRWILQLICLGSIGAIGALDIWIQQDILLFALYLIPVGISSWSLGRQFSDFIVILCSVVWAVTAIADPANLELRNILWNTLFFAIMLWTLSVLLTNLRVATEVEKELLRVDPITGAINRAFFMELLQAEYNRSQRYGYPLTLASVELSRKNGITTHFTHDQVESLLADIADQLGFQLRSNDVVARLDEYEFGILLPHTDSDQADVVLNRLKEDLSENPVLNQSDLKCRVGSMTFLSMPEETEDLIDQTQRLLASLQSDRSLQFAHKVFQ